MTSGLVQERPVECATRTGEDDALLRTYGRTRDPVVRERLVRQHLPLVRALARRYVTSGEPLDDLVQVGTIGLIEAIDRFEPERGGTLAAFAVPTITGHVRHYLRDRAPCVKVPRRVTELRGSLRSSRSRLTRTLARSPTVAELAEDAGVRREDVLLALESEQALAPVPLPPDDGHAEGLRADPLEASDDRILVAAAFRALGARERRLLHLRFYAGLSQAEIAHALGLSQVHVSRLIQASLTRMRLAVGSKEPVVDDERATARG